jgi:hypothetical protein
MVRNLVIEVEPAEPSIREMKFDFLGQLAFRAQAIGVPDDEHADHQLAINRRPADLAVVRHQPLVHIGESRRYKPVNAPEKMVLRDPIIEPELIGKTRLIAAPPTHKRDCDVCAFKMQCCPHAPSRWIPRDFHEDARDVARALAKTEAFERSRRERKKVEMCFAHMTRIFKLDRLRLRGLSGAKDEVLLTATAQNLRRLVKFLCRPPPSAAVTCTA